MPAVRTSLPEHLNHFNRKSLGRACESLSLREVSSRTVGRLPSDVLTRRVPMPNLIKPAVRGITACVAFAVECTTRFTGTGAVLVFLAQKQST